MGGFWRACSDHTSGSGNYMWIVPVVELYPGIDNSAWKETVTVSKNTDYLFTMWSSTIGLAPSNLFVLINNDTLLSEFQTPGAPNDCVWGKKCKTWNSGNATFAIIEIIPWYAGGLGKTALGLDDLSFHSCSVLSAVEETNNSFISVSPNLSSGRFNLYGNFEGETLHILLTSITGREIAYLQVESSAKNGVIPLDFADYESGFYFLEVVTLKGIFATKFCIQK